MAVAVHKVQEAFEMPFPASKLPEMADGCEEETRTADDLNEQLVEEEYGGLFRKMLKKRRKPCASREENGLTCSALA